jgi:hypothetical protein
LELERRGERVREKIDRKKLEYIQKNAKVNWEQKEDNQLMTLYLHNAVEKEYRNRDT